jgi:hypothetical protein
MNMKRSLILLCGLLTGFTLQSTKVNAQTQTVANDQKLVYPYTFAPSEGLMNQTEKEHRQEICINGYWDFQPVRLPKEYVQGKGIAPELPLPENDSEWSKTRIKIPSPWNINAFVFLAEWKRFQGIPCHIEDCAVRGSHLSLVDDEVVTFVSQPFHTAFL